MPPEQPSPADPLLPHIKPPSAVAGLLDKDEYVVLILRRHPFGLLLIYFQAFVAILAVLLLFAFVGPEVLDDTPDNVKTIIGGVALFGLGIMLLILLVTTYIYRLNQIIITNKEVVQVLQRGLFSRKISQLSLSNVEDVSADQHGIFSTLFGYGTMTIQTAGELENFIFPYCPQPNQYADLILDARHRYDPKHPA